jgi:AcrR family transcriptional regulator
VACAQEVFLQNGFHGTSIDAIARAANGSRATIYQYFAGKEDIFGELARASEKALRDLGDQLGHLGPDSDRFSSLNQWILDWADVYDSHAAVFGEFPGIGTVQGLAVLDARPVAEDFRRQVTDRVAAAPLSGLEPDEAAAALMRIPHMVNLYRYRATFPLPGREAVSRSLAIALQLMLFPDTPSDVIDAPGSADASAPKGAPKEIEAAQAPDGRETSAVAADVLSAGSQLFAERGYHAVAMEDIAAAADISRATLYRHFNTKHMVLAELTRRAVAGAEGHAARLCRIAGEPLDVDRFSEWMLGYVRFHRGYRGVIRAWFDGTVAEQLSGASVSHGIGSMYDAVHALLARAPLPSGMDPAAATAVFLAVLGRMTEPVGSIDEDQSDQRAAELMVRLLRRSLLRPAAGSQTGQPASAR